MSDRRTDRRRVGFRTTPIDDNDQSSAKSPDLSYMMLRDDDAARMTTTGAHVFTPGASGSSLPGASDETSKFPKLSARELAHIADSGMKRATVLGEMAVNRAAGLAAPIASRARTVSKVPFLTSVAGFGGKRAPTETAPESSSAARESPQQHGSDGDGPPPPDGDLDVSNARCRSPKRGARHSAEAPPTRKIFLNDESKNSNFPSNYISTTKYSLLTALPMFLFEQFSRFSNAYFLVVGILYTVDAVSPIFTVGRYSTLWVLAIVVLISGIKEGIEDFRRYREDRRLNSAVTHIVGSSRPHDRWDSVSVGDIIKVYEKEPLPADIALVSSSSEDGLAYIETKQLDGESNLKVKVVPAGIEAAFRSESAALLAKGCIESEAPNDRLYKYVGRFILTNFSAESPPGSKGFEEHPPAISLNTPVPLGPENLLIRGSSLRNTEWVMGVVVNTGRDTKLMQNVKPRPRKNSRLERETNRHYFLVVVLQVCIVVALTIRSAQVCPQLYGPSVSAWYLGNIDKGKCNAGEAFTRFFTFFITFAQLIPISLYISMEIVRGFQVYFMEHDMHMRDAEAGIKAEVRTSNLNEELGVVHYVFTDKTGTLTANKMVFKKCSLRNKVYEWADVAEPGATSMRDLQNALQAGPESSAVRNYTVDELEAADTALRLLAICHSVVSEVPEPLEEDEEMEEMDSQAIAWMRPLPRPRWPRRFRTDSFEGTSSEIAENGQRQSGQSREDVSGTLEDWSRNPSSLSSDSYRRRDRDSDMPGEKSSDGELRPPPAPLNGDEIRYQASSPDEAALVNAARAHGYTFLSRSSRTVAIEVHGRVEHHELLQAIDFDSTRKRMSVVTRDQNGRIRLFMKGADAVIFDRLAEGQSSETTEEHLHDFAVEGLRTLCLAYADLDKDWFEDWHRRYQEASGVAQDREENLEALADELERNLTLLGATAIEDKLQEGVPETLRKLEQAGVKVWILTGDKQETAINIGLSCGVIDDGMDVVIINEDNMEDTSAQLDRAIGRWSALLQDPGMEPKLGLVLDGQTLHYALEPELQKKVIMVSRLARTVIACRVSPKQKTELVELVRRHENEKVTLAIGDGANDVGMIQAAHVGVGIVGLEGQEAKLASDYSIAQFRYLARLMLVHGRWSYKRLAKMVLYTIYKNATLTMCELYWATMSAYTGQPLFDPWVGGLYSVVVTSMPAIILGILDQELTADYALMFPEVYKKGQRNSAFSARVFINWLFASIWQSAVIYYTTFWSIGEKPISNGQHLGMWAFGIAIYSIVVIDVHIMLLVYQSTWTKFSAAFFLLSLVSWFIIGPIFSSKAVALSANLSPPMYAIVHKIFAQPQFWMIMVLCPVLCVSPSLLWKYHKRRQRPNMKMLVQELIRSGKTREEITGELPKPLRRVPSYDPSAPATPSGPVTFVRNGEREYLFSGFNFDNDESGVVLRRGFELARGARRMRMRYLKRAGSDTELDVEGVKSAVRESPRSNRRRVRSCREIDEDLLTDDSDQGPYETTFTARPRRRRPPRYPTFDDEEEVALRLPGPILPNVGDNGSATSPVPSSHRRAISDGAVLVENQYMRFNPEKSDTAEDVTRQKP